MTYDSSAAQLERKCRKFVSETEKVRTNLEIKVVAEFKSRFLGSRYKMVYMPMEWIGKWGQLGPDYVLCQVQVDGNVMQPLRKAFPSIPVRWPLDFETPRRAVESDIALVPTDSADAVEAAIDIVTAACPEHPLVFLNNIYEVYEISNTLMGEWIWTQYEVDDSIKHLLTAIRIVGVDSNSYLSQNYPAVRYERSLFTPYDSTVRAPVAQFFEKDSIKIELYSWTIGSSLLIRWNVVFAGGDKVSIYHEELIDESLGFHFMCY